MQMDTKTKRTVAENGDASLGEDLVLATLIANGEDLGPLVRHAFEMGRPEGLLHQLKHVMKKKRLKLRRCARLTTRTSSSRWMSFVGC